MTLDISKQKKLLKKGKGPLAVGAMAVGASTTLPTDVFGEVANVGSQMILEEVLDAGAIKILQGLKAGASATPIGLGLTTATTTISPAGEGSAFEKRKSVCEYVGC